MQRKKLHCGKRFIYKRQNEKRNILFWGRSSSFVMFRVGCNESLPRPSATEPATKDQEIRSLRSLTSSLLTNPTLASLSELRVASRG